MNRTDELLKEGAERMDGGGSHPFVKWPDEYAYVEGELRQLWDGKYGEVATVNVQDLSANLVAVLGSGEERVEVPIQKEETVNVGLSYAVLRDAFTKNDVGALIHVAFVDWSETRDGDRFRQFTVLRLSGPDGTPQETDENAYITHDQAKRFYVQAMKVLAEDPQGPEVALRNLIAEATNGDPKQVTLKKIRHVDMPDIMSALEEYKALEEATDPDDDLPF